MKTMSIQSGSSGNCYYYESGRVKLLFDAGISFRLYKERMTEAGLSPYGIKGIFISHDHSDHSSSAGVFHRQLQAPLFMTPSTKEAIRESLGDVREILHYTADEVTQVGHVRVRGIKTPHDAVDPCIFLIEDGSVTVGIFTDLGSPTKELQKALRDIDVVYLESNFDDRMLNENTEYPDFLKERIKGGKGHISNLLSANLIKKYASKRLKHLILSHLSSSNNTENLALKTHREVYGEETAFQIHIASKDRGSTLIEIGD